MYTYQSPFRTRSFLAVAGRLRIYLSTVSRLAIGLTIVAAPAHAADIDWVGGTSNDFNDASNWAGNVAPASTDNINVDIAPGNWLPVIGSGDNIQIGTVHIGENGDGAMTLTSGGGVTSGDTFLGDGIGSTGLLTVTGASSGWSSFGNLWIGAFGDGQVTINNGGGVLATNNAILGARSGVTGTASVDGVNSRLIANSTLMLGQFNGATGNLIVSNGGIAEASQVSVGRAVGGTGNVLVNGGTIQSFAVNIGEGGTGTVTLTNGGTLDMNGSQGGGPVRLGSIAGSTGTLNIGADAASSAASAGNLLGATGLIFGPGNGTLNFNHTEASYVFATDISGAGAIQQRAGVTSLTGNNIGFTGQAFVTGGSLLINGGMDNGDAVVSGGGTLGGNDRIGSVVANAGGTVAPGNSIGVLHVVNNTTFNAGSIFKVEVNAAGQSDQLQIGGSATLNGGSVQVLAANQSYSANTSYDILHADGGVNGAFGGVSSNLAFLTPSLTYDPSNVYLNLAVNGVAFGDVAETPNQKSVAGALQSLGAGNPIYDAVQSLDAASARRAYDALSGEVHASTSGALMTNAHYVSGAVIGRLRSDDVSSDNVAASQLAALETAAKGVSDADPAYVEQPGRPSAGRHLWGQAFGGWSEHDGDGNAARLNDATAGFMVGLDSEFAPGWRLGLATGFSHSDLQAGQPRSDAGVDAYHIAAYGGGHVGSVSLRLGAAYSYNRIDSSRDVSVGSTASITSPSAIGETEKADYSAHVAQIFGEVGYDARIGRLALEPFAGMSYVHLSTDSFTEHGGVAALHGYANRQDLPASMLGLRAGGEIMHLGEATVTANAMLGWQHAFGDVTPTTTFAFASGSADFAIAGTPIARNALVTQLGLDLTVNRQLAIGLSYDGQLANESRDHSVRGKVSWSF